MLPSLAYHALEAPPCCHSLKRKMEQHCHGHCLKRKMEQYSLTKTPLIY